MTKVSRQEIYHGAFTGRREIEDLKLHRHVPFEAGWSGDDESARLRRLLISGVPVVV
jgi:hypothetical protein